MRSKQRFTIILYNFLLCGCWNHSKPPNPCERDQAHFLNNERPFGPDIQLTSLCRYEEIIQGHPTLRQIYSWLKRHEKSQSRKRFLKKRTTKNRLSTDFSDQERIIFSLLNLAVIHYAMKTLRLSQSHLLTMASSGAFLRPANRASLLKFSAEHCGHPTFFVSFLSVFPLLCKAI